MHNLAEMIYSTNFQKKKKKLSLAVADSVRFYLWRQPHFLQELHERTLQILLRNSLIVITLRSQVLLNQLEEPHQLVLLRQPQAFILEYRGPRVRHVLQSPIFVAKEARIDALEVYVLVGPRFQYQIDGFIGAE